MQRVYGFYGRLEAVPLPPTRVLSAAVWFGLATGAVMLNFGVTAPKYILATLFG